ncbi:MAG: response regulator [Pontiellaceae bacterium]|nr:response regulator [Pontiellaceae bacterium]MBN2786632.1 response regulator [Pontiellaceae bacterium]
MIHAAERALVVVADDDIIVRMLAEECLGELGFSVLVVGNGQEAVDACMERNPDLVVLDVMMPVMDGMDACREIRNMPGNEYLPILMMTALDDVAAIDSAFKAGASEYTMKPVNWHVEGHRLRNMISSAASRREVDLTRREWERTFDAVDDIVIILDLDLRVIQSNAAAKRAISIEGFSLAGHLCSEIHGCNAEKCGHCPLSKAIETGEHQQAKRFDGCRSGSYLVSAHPVRDESGALSRIVYMAKDITLQERLREEVLRSKKLSALGTLSGGLAHDFNNLLQVIIGNADIATLDLEPDSEPFDCITEIRGAAVRGREIIDQLMTIARGGEDGRRIVVSLNIMLTELFSMMKRTFPSSIKLEMETEPHLDLTLVNKVQFEQVIMNLAINARHAMPDGGLLKFTTKNITLDEFSCESFPGLEPGRYICLSVADTGCGMDENTREHMYEPFFTTKKTGEGSGLGLASAYGVVQRHGGSIVCESAPGKGTRFDIYLPACDVGATPAPPDGTINSESSSR